MIYKWGINMSLPNIPDIDPKINLTFEDVINLLLASIAMEEISLSKLLEAEKDKILCVVNKCKGKGSTLHEAKEINKSVADLIKNMIKLQMLLQFKLDSIKEILPTTSTSTTTTTSTSTTTSSTSTGSTTTKKACCCSLIGNAKGCVSNCCDEFDNQPASLYAFLFCCDPKNRTIRYSVGNEDLKLQLYASGHDIKVKNPCCCCDSLVIYGRGCVDRALKGKPNISGPANFILTVRNRAGDMLEFRMEIKSDAEPKFNHDSGFTQVKNVWSDLKFKICC